MRLLQKIEILQTKNPLPSASNPNGSLQASDDITPLALWGRGRSSEKRNASSMTSWGISPYFPPIAHHTEKVSECKATASDRSEDSKTRKTVIESDPPPWPSKIVPTPTSDRLSGKKISEHQDKNWIDPIGDQMNKLGQSGSSTYPSW